MEKRVSAWTTAPERRFSDVASPNPAWDAEQTREALHAGLRALSASARADLILPPVKAFAPKRAGGRKDLHYHRYTEIGIVTRGEMTIWWEGVATHCPVGAVFVIPPGVRYLPHVQDPVHPSPPHTVVWLALHRGCAISHRCSLEGKEHRLSEYYCFTESQVMGLARNMAQELADRALGYEAVVRGSLLCLLTWLLRAPVHSISEHGEGLGDRRTGTPETFRERVESYLRSHYHRPLTLAQIARSVGCSPAYLCRHFRELAGLTPFQFLRSVRLEAAKRLLCSEVPIARVAEMVGFDDPLYFSKVFSAQTGESPQSFRRRQVPPAR